MDHEFALSEEETIRLDFPWSRRNFSFFFLTKRRKIVNEFPRISTVRNHEPKFKGVVTDYFASEIVSLYHLKILDWRLSYAKVHRESNCLQIQKIWPQVVFDHSFRRVIIVTELFIIDVIVGNFNKRDV